MVDVADVSTGGEDDSRNVVDDVAAVLAASRAVEDDDIELVDFGHHPGFPFPGVGADFLHDGG